MNSFLVKGGTITHIRKSLIRKYNEDYLNFKFVCPVISLQLPTHPVCLPKRQWDQAKYISTGHRQPPGAEKVGPLPGEMAEHG